MRLDATVLKCLVEFGFLWFPLHSGGYTSGLSPPLELHAGTGEMDILYITIKHLTARDAEIS
jgi:hypothetical protein